MPDSKTKTQSKRESSKRPNKARPAKEQEEQEIDIKKAEEVVKKAKKEREDKLKAHLKYIENYCEENGIELYSGLPKEQFVLALSELLKNPFNKFIKTQIRIDFKKDA